MSDTEIAPGAQTERGAPAAPDNTLPLEAPKDQYGRPAEQHLERYPEDSPARKGATTPPSGQGGATPHDGISHQDMFPPNPEPSESAKAKGEENDRIARGETTEVDLANERLASITGTEAESEPVQEPVVVEPVTDQPAADPYGQQS